MDYNKNKKQVHSKEELEAYLKTLPEEAQDQINEMLGNIEGRMMLSVSIGETLLKIHEKFPDMKHDGLSILSSILVVAATSNLDRIILDCLHKGGVMELIKNIIQATGENENPETEIKDILKDFKFNNN